MSGADLKTIRERLGLSQYELSQLCGVSRNRLSLAECEYSRLSSGEIQRILRAITEHRARVVESLAAIREFSAVEVEAQTACQ